jgi:hypothetical protein
MAFGVAAKTPQKKETTNEAKSDIFFDTKIGIRDFRVIPGDELRVREIFFAKEADGSWVPTFGYDPNDRRTKKPVTIATFNAVSETWEYGGAWGTSPVDEYVASLDVSEEDRKKMYAKEKFLLVVLNRTKIKTLPDGSILYPDSKMKYPVGSESIVAQRMNKVQILQGSSGNPRDEDGNFKGKHLYRDLLETAENQLDVEGNPRNIIDYDMRLNTSGKGIDTKRSFSVIPGADEVIDWSTYKTFDIASWKRPWDFGAIRTLMAGGDYNELLKMQNLTMYPLEVDIDMGEATF